MRLENSFEVPAPIDEVWTYLLDVEKVVPCMPGAELTEAIDETTWKGKIRIRLGAVTMQFAGQVAMQERDDEEHRVVIKASAMEQHGKGAASATVASTLQDVRANTTHVSIVQDLVVSGQVAQISRGILPHVTAKLTQQFADCVKTNIEAAQLVAPGEQPREVTAGEIRPLSLGAGALWAAIKRFLRSSFRKK